jgi:hypothetical protein
VISSTRVLGIELEAGDITVTNACGAAWWAPNVSVAVNYDHVYEALDGFLGTPSVPIRAQVTMRNE